MYRIKQIKEVFRGFSLDKAAFSIVHINGDKRKTHFPFVIHPECADNCLQETLCAEQVHDYDQGKSMPAVISVKDTGKTKKSCNTDKLQKWIFP